MTSTLAGMENDDEVMAAYIARHTSDYRKLCEATRGRDIDEAERLVRDFANVYQPHAREIDIAFTARVLSDARWGRRHPIAAIALAWRHRGTRPMRESLLWLWRPRFAG
jgi:hypothetical protein